MTDKEFEAALEQRDVKWGQLASEAWCAWTKKEREAATLADLEADVQDTLLSIEEAKMVDAEDLFRNALNFYGYDVEKSLHNDFLRKHADTLICGYQEGVAEIDMDFWMQYEELLDEKMSYDEYIFVDKLYEGDPLELTDVGPSDDEKVGFAGVKEALFHLRTDKIDEQGKVGALVAHYINRWTPDNYDTIRDEIASEHGDMIAAAANAMLEKEYRSWFGVDATLEDAKEKAASFNNAKKLEEHTYGNHIFMRLEVDGEVHEVSNYAGSDGSWDTYSTTADGTDKRDAVIKAFNELY